MWLWCRSPNNNTCATRVSRAQRYINQSLFGKWHKCSAFKVCKNHKSHCTNLSSHCTNLSLHYTNLLSHCTNLSSHCGKAHNQLEEMGLAHQDQPCLQLFWDAFQICVSNVFPRGSVGPRLFWDVSDMLRWAHGCLGLGSVLYHGRDLRKDLKDVHLLPKTRPSSSSVP